MSRHTSTRVTQPRVMAVPVETCLVRIYPPGDEMGRRFALTGDVSIGRDGTNTIVVDADSVSRRHARILCGPDAAVIVDLGSTNGTFVNDIAIREHTLRNGDLLRIGGTIFKFLRGSVESLYHAEIYRLTIVDGLTEAYNKRYVLDQLERDLARCRRHQHPLALLMMDVDHFKRINDTYGHLAGDYVLRELSALVRGRVRRADVFGRYGGEEFALVMPETSREAACRFAGDIRERVAAHGFQFDGAGIPVTISGGIGMLDDQAIDAVTLVRAADEKLYEAKRTGRNRIVT